MSFVLSKIFWMLVAPANFLALLLLLGAFMAVARGEAWRRWGRRICFVVALAWFAIGVFPVGAWLVKPLEDRYPPETPARVDGVILLAGDENPRLTAARQQPAITTSARRYVAFASLAQAYPDARLAFVGGYPDLAADSALSNAAVARQALTELGIAPERVVYEDKSRNTFENAVYAMDVVKPRKEENWLLVTSAYHMPRALQCFRAAGWTIFPATTDYLSPANHDAKIHFSIFEHLPPLHYAVHEYYGLVAYWLMGRISWPWGASS